MRKTLFVVILLPGISSGWLAAHDLDRGTQVVMMAVGALFGGAIGGGLSRLGAPHMGSRQVAEPEGLSHLSYDSFGAQSREEDENFWRDEGHPTLSKPPRPELGDRMFDADRNL